MCAFAHFLAARDGTQREHRLSRLLFFFMSTHSCKHGGGVLLYRYSNVRFCALPCRSQWYSTRTPFVAVIVLFYVHALVQAWRWASCYITIVMCAFAHFLAARDGTQREHRLSRLLFFFMSTHSCKHGGGVLLYRYSNVRFCALPCRLQWYSTRTPFVAVIVLFMSAHSCKHGGGVLLYRYSNVRFCALPCRSQWYSTRTPFVAVIVLFYAHTLVQARWWA